MALNGFWYFALLANEVVFSVNVLRLAERNSRQVVQGLDRWIVIGVSFVAGRFFLRRHQSSLTHHVDSQEHGKVTEGIWHPQRERNDET